MSFQSFKMRKSAAVVQTEVKKLSKQDDHSGSLILDGESTATGVNTQYQSHKQNGTLQSKILNRAKVPYNPVQQLEEARFKRVDEQKQNIKEKLESQTYKSYQKIEDIPEDWSLKTAIDISISNPEQNYNNIYKKVKEVCKFYVFTTKGAQNASYQSQSK